jgi:pimeloyl-ACP methyl ester carboxylesterase
MVILLDARGHGRSDAPTDANAYSVEHRVSDVAAVMDEVNLETTDYWGYSMGGTIGFHLAQSQPDRVKRVVAGAASSRPGETYAERCLARAAAFRTKDPAAIAEMGEMSEDLSARFVATNNMEALAALQEAWATWKGINLRSIEAPLFQYCGEQDTALLQEIRHTVSDMPTGRFAQLDDCDHLTAFLRVKVAMAAVMPFFDV